MKKIIIIAGDPNSINSEIIFKVWKRLSKSTKKRIFLIANHNLIKATNIVRNSANGTDLTTESISELFNVGLNNLSIVRTNDNQLGVAFVKNISEPKDRISSNFFEEVKENVIQNYNNSLNSAIGNKIIDNTPYEIFTQNIENILM